MNRLLIAALLILASCHRAAMPAPLAGAAIGGPFSLTDQNGRAVTERSFAGQYRIMYFGYTSCPDVCPVDMQVVGAALKLLEHSDPSLAARVTPVFITVDPARDTPAVLKTFTAAFHPRMVGLTGSAEAIAATAKEYAVYYRKGTVIDGSYIVDHSRTAYLMDSANKPLALLPTDKGAQATADEIERWAR